MELEHQIGRLINYKKIFNEIHSNNLKGDIIEFGVWKGFSVLWIAYICERIGIFDKKIIGLDGFIGLPESDGVFKKGIFKDVSLETCRKNIYYSNYLYDITKKNIFIEKFLFNHKKEILERLKKIGAKKFVFIHIDCDLGSASQQVFDLLSKGDLLENQCYILFDDYGHDSELKEIVKKNLKKLESNWEIEEHSRTGLTRNFKLTRY
ncbi:TylF/MycF family methyltransferase [bacterium]|nr:TylF/MycF family methyltransferase [bacterium]